MKKTKFINIKKTSSNPMKKLILLTLIVFSLSFVPVSAQETNSCETLLELFTISYNTQEGDDLFISTLDFNENQEINLEDFAILAENYENEDWCGNILNDFDYTYFLTDEGSCSIVSELFSISYNTNSEDPLYYPPFDFNEDDSIAIQDFAILASNYGNEEWCQDLLKTNVLVTIESEGEEGLYTITGLVRNIGYTTAREVYIELKSDSELIPEESQYLGNIEPESSQSYEFQVNIGEEDPEDIEIYTEAIGVNFDRTSSNIIPLPIHWIVLLLFGISLITITKVYNKK